MGIGDMLDLAVKTPVTNGLKSSYSLGSAAITKINNTIRGGGGGNRDDENLMKQSHPGVVVAAVGKETIMGNDGERKMSGFNFKDVLGSAAAGVKTPVSNVLKSSYSLGSATVSKIDNVVREGGANRVEKLKEYMSSPEHQEKISCAITHPATKELVKLLVPPGGVGAYKVAAAVLKNQQSTNAHVIKKFEQEMKVLRDDNDKMRADLEQMKDLVYSFNQLNNSTTTTPIRFKSPSTIEREPEEVVCVFMMKGLRVRDFMDNQVVPPIRGPIDRA